MQMKLNEIWITKSEYPKHKFLKGSDIIKSFPWSKLNPSKEYDYFLREVVIV